MHGQLTFGKTSVAASFQTMRLRLVRMLVPTLVPTLVLTALTACGPRVVYDLAPPETPEGRACAAQCQSSAALCRQMQQHADQQCRNNHALMLRNYNACVESGSDACVMPPRCTSLSGRECSQSFRECFAACGGTVTARVIEKQ